MAAKTGNQLWKLRAKHGRDKLFETPEFLWEAAVEYFENCDKNPWKRQKVPYTLTGFLVFIEANKEYWRDFKKAQHNGFSGVIEKIEMIIYDQKYTGAAVGAFNANIISRDLGLVDKQEHTGKDGQDLFGSKSDDELKNMLNTILTKLG
jgi:hypothetical protein